MKTAHLIKDLNQLRESYLKTVYEKAEQIRKEIMIPFCISHECDFISGNGTFFLYKESTDDYDYLNKNKRIEKLLNTPIDESFSIGDFVQNVRFKDHLN